MSSSSPGPPEPQGKYRSFFLSLLSEPSQNKKLCLVNHWVQWWEQISWKTKRGSLSWREKKDGLGLETSSDMSPDSKCWGQRMRRKLLGGSPQEQWLAKRSHARPRQGRALRAAALVFWDGSLPPLVQWQCESSLPYLRPHVRRPLMGERWAPASVIWKQAWCKLGTQGRGYSCHLWKNF